jgi:hypothetical protein
MPPTMMMMLLRCGLLALAPAFDAPLLLSP